MRRSSVSLGAVAGIKVYVHWTFLLLIVWIILQNVRSGLTWIPILWTLAFVLSLFVCVVLHELGHALTARRYGIKTRDITLYPIGGVASLESIPRKPKEELLVSLAGPAVNLLIAALLYPFIDFSSITKAETLAQIRPDNFIFAFAFVNIWLALFNLIPAFPMDGGRVFRALLSFRMDRAKATRIAARVGQVLAVFFMIVGFYVNPFLIFIGLFIFLGAQVESNYAQSERLLEGQTVMAMTMLDVPTVSGTTTAGALVRELLNSQKKNFVVEEQGKVSGVVTQKELLKALTQWGEKAIASDFMNKEVLWLPAALPVRDAIVKMQSANSTVALVVDGGRYLGMVDNDNLVEFILVQQAKQSASQA